MRAIAVLCGAVSALLCCCGVEPVEASEASKAPAPVAIESPAAAADPGVAAVVDPEASSEGRAVYLGREIAQTMHWRGAEWLIRETRESEEHASELIAALGVEPGQTVCDLGCGNGFHTLRLAELVGDAGKVFAVDIQPEMLELLEARAERAGIDNVVPILGTFRDPGLPADACDLVLLVDVYHELSHPVSMLRAIRRALKPGGRVAFVEFRAEDPSVPIKPLHKMAKAQVRKEVEPIGFRLAGEYDELPWQHVLLFERDDAKSGK